MEEVFSRLCNSYRKLKHPYEVAQVLERAVQRPFETADDFYAFVMTQVERFCDLGGTVDGATVTMWFIQGLPPDIQQLIHGMYPRPTNIEDVLFHAKRFEQAKKLTKTSQKACKTPKSTQNRQILIKKPR